MKDEDVGIAMIMGIVLFLFVIAVGLGAILLRGWVLSYMWMWFIAEPFSIAPLSVLHAIGIACIVSLFMSSTSRKKEEDESPSKQMMITLSSLFLNPIITLWMGYLVHLWM